MFVTVYSATLEALEAKIVSIEVDVSSGLPATVIVGLPDVSIRESKERVRACLRQSEQYSFPLGRISINLAPAGLYKYGTHFDAGIAVGILRASNQIVCDLSEAVLFGELSLNGTARPVRGILAFALAVREAGLKIICVPDGNVSEAALVSGLRVIGYRSLQDLADIAVGGFKRQAAPAALGFSRPVESGVDFSFIAGQEFAKRGLEIAAAGGHNISLTGPPGSGKTVLAQAFPTILPDLSPEEAFEVMRIYSVAGLLGDGRVVVPFRNPHTGITATAFVGGGRIPQPGEITLAHRGVLFMDEFPEFQRDVIEALRQPLEYGFIKISRVQQHYTFPANFILVTAQNPCPCGYYGEADRECSCTLARVLAYRKKISGPILDRIDLHISVGCVGISKFNGKPAEPSHAVAARIAASREIQRRRQGNILNSRLSKEDIDKWCCLSDEALLLVRHAFGKYRFSARSYFKILRLSRTIADLAGSSAIAAAHVAEAIGYRFKENLLPGQ